MRILKGKIATGKNSSAKNLKKKNVDEKIAAQMGFSTLHPGTLNIELDETYLIKYNYNGYIEKNEYNDRECIKLERCRLNGVKSIIVCPQDHNTVGTFKKRIELMSPHNLRKKFSLSDGDYVEVEVEGDENWWNLPDIEGNVQWFRPEGAPIPPLTTEKR